MSKRNKTTARATRHRGSSPYHKYQKREVDYSGHYRRNPHLAEGRRRAAKNAMGLEVQ